MPERIILFSYLDSCSEANHRSCYSYMTSAIRQASRQGSVLANVKSARLSYQIHTLPAPLRLKPSPSYLPYVQPQEALCSRIIPRAEKAALCRDRTPREAFEIPAVLVAVNTVNYALLCGLMFKVLKLAIRRVYAQLAFNCGVIRKERER